MCVTEPIAVGAEIVKKNKTMSANVKSRSVSPTRQRWFGAVKAQAIAGCAIAAMGTVATMPGRVQAAVVNTTTTWIGGGGNSLWSNIYNWYLNDAPVNNSNVIIGGSATPSAPAVADVSLTLASLTIDANSGMAIAAGNNIGIGSGGYVNDNGQITINSAGRNHI